jgi:beta-xylosidase
LDVQRCDFVTFNGLPPAGAAVDAKELIDHATALRQKVTTALGETVPLILSAWSVAGVGHPTAHDRCAAGAAVAAAMAPLAEVVNGAIYGAMTDVDDEAAPRFEPFHGGRGLVTVNDVRKASFNVLKLLNEHIGYRVNWNWIEPADGLTAFVSKDYHHVVRILASYDRWGATGPAKFEIQGLPTSVQWGQVQVIRPGAGSALESWVEQGQPPFVNRGVLDDLEAGSHPATTEVNFIDYPPRLEPGMTLQLTIPIPDDALGNTD